MINNIVSKYGQTVNFDGLKTYDTVGCERCHFTGFYDRIGIYEVLLIDDKIKELIIRNASSIEIRNQALRQQFRPLVIDGIQKVLEGQTTLQELNKKLAIF